MGKFEQHNFLEKLLWLLFGQCVVKLGYFLVYRLVALPVPMNALCKWQHWHIFLLFFTRRKFRSNLQQKWSTKKFKYKVFKCTATTSTCTPTYLPQTSLNGVVQHAAVKITICLNFTKAFSRSSHFHFQFISSLSRPLCRKCHSSLLFSKWWLTMMKYSKRKLLFCVWGQILHFERSDIESRYSCQRNFCAHNLYLRCFGWRFWSYDVWIHKNLVAARVKAVCTLKKTCFDIPM